MSNEDMKTTRLCEELVKELAKLRKENARLKAIVETRNSKNKTSLLVYEEVLYSIIKKIPDIVYRLNNKGHIVFINDAVKKYGYYPEELLGISIMDLIPPEDRERAVYRVNERRTGERSTKDMEIVLKRKRPVASTADTSDKDIKASKEEDTKDRTEAIFLINAEGLYRTKKNKSSSFIGTQGIARDITNRKKIEEALDKSEKWFSELLENSIDIQYRLNYRTGSYDYISPAIKRLIGLTPGEVISKGFRELLKLLHPEDREHSLNYWKTLVEQDGNTSANVFRIKSSDGDYRWVSDNCTLIMDSENNSHYIIGNARDITLQKQAEVEKKNLEEKLRHAEKMEAVGRLAGGVAHDLNNVLSSIISYPDLILMNLPEDSRVIRPLKTIQRAGQRAVAIVQDLLTLARRAVKVNKVINLNKLIEEYFKSPEYEKLHSYHPNVKVKLTLSLGLSNIMGSPVHLLKTIMNLVSNASEAMPEGGVLSITTSNRFFDAPMNSCELCIPKGYYAELELSDNGVGIAKRDIEKIFEPFYTKKEMGRSGTGLGMAVVWNTVKDCNGSIEVCSQEGAGTTFKLYFPITMKEAVGDGSSGSLQELFGKGETILVVDDGEDQREISSLLLTSLGYKVETASSGEAAIEYLKNNSVDLVILDMIMEPGIDGLDTYRQIRLLNPGLKVIISSGYIETGRVKEARRLGVGQYVKKPFSMEIIARAVKKELSHN
ncbi:MAG: PAS domain S-box protein [bacterium]|nr:PAS domain S-box protein [bacterium]